MASLTMVKQDMLGHLYKKLCETFGDHFLEDWEHVDDINTEGNGDNVTHGRQDGSRSAVAVHNAISQFLNNTS